MTPTGTGVRWPALAVVVLAGALFIGLSVGPVPIPVRSVVLALVDHLPVIDVHSGLDTRETAILWDLRAPRVVLGAMVGATLALSGASYQGVFRNPLADPYLLGAAAGAGLGATLAIAYRPYFGGVAPDAIPLTAFVGALAGVAAAYVLGRTAGGGRSPAALVLAGVAVASFLTALQTWVLQRNSDTLREVYDWILGRLTTADWADVRLALPYMVVAGVALLAHRRLLDVLRVGEDEAAALGLNVARLRLTVVVAASLATAAAVAVSGLIAFVGIIVPHLLRLTAGASYRRLLPLSVLFGAAFLVLADVVARTVAAPAEVPIGVVTAFVGAPFFAVVLATSRRSIW
ncbi:MAG TPA: iron ABC transporter permease [Acidimicrobiales bacterium]|nr:iron ABC transporter permease [Acidimicrobiales bacterium]